MPVRGYANKRNWVRIRQTTTRTVHIGRTAMGSPGRLLPGARWDAAPSR